MREADALDVVRAFFDACAKHAPEEALECLEEDAVAEGFDASGARLTRKGLAAALEKMEISGADGLECAALADNISQVSGSVLCKGGRARFLATCRQSSLTFRDSEEIKLCSIAVSCPKCLLPVYTSLDSAELDAIQSSVDEKSRELLRAAMQGGMAGFYVEDGLPLYCVNDPLLACLGYTREEFDAQTKGLYANALYPDDVEYVTDKLGALLQKGDGEYELNYRLRKKDCGCIWVLDRGRRVPDGGSRIAVTGMIFDLTNLVSLQNGLKEMTGRLKQANCEMEKFYNTMIDGIAKLEDTPGLRLLYASKGLRDMLFGGKALAGQSLRDYLHPGDIQAFDEAAQRLRARGGRVSSELRFKTAGGWRWLRQDMALSDETSSGGGVLFCVYTDIDGHKLLEQKYIRQQYYMALIAEQTDGGTLVAKFVDGYPIAYQGGNMPRLLGYSSAEELYQSCGGELLRLMHPSDRQRADAANREQLAGCGHSETEFRLRMKDGDYLWVLARARSVKDIGGEDILTCFLTDITARKERESILKERSQSDLLTQTYNRVFSEREIDDYLRHHPAGLSALVIIDVDDFKQINDTCGHIAGDTVLREIAAVIKGSFRQQDIVGRLGGDEFIVFMKDIKTPALIERKADMLCGRVSNRFFGRYSDTQVSISVGIAVTGGKEATFMQLYGEADKALYSAKASGKNTWRVSDLSAL